MIEPPHKKNPARFVIAKMALGKREKALMAELELVRTSIEALEEKVIIDRELRMNIDAIDGFEIARKHD